MWSPEEAGCEKEDISKHYMLFQVAVGPKSHTFAEAGTFMSKAAAVLGLEEQKKKGLGGLDGFTDTCVTSLQKPETNA